MGDKEEELVQNKKNLCVTKTNKKVTGWLLLLSVILAQSIQKQTSWKTSNIPCNNSVERPGE